MCSTLGKAHTLNSRITEGRALKQLYVFGRVGRAKLSSQKPRVGGFARPPQKLLPHRRTARACTSQLLLSVQQASSQLIKCYLSNLLTNYLEGDEGFCKTTLLPYFAKEILLKLEIFPEITLGYTSNFCSKIGCL